MLCNCTEGLHFSALNCLFVGRNIGGLGKQILTLNLSDDCVMSAASLIFN